MNLTRQRNALVADILDRLEVLTGEQVLCVVTLSDDGILQPWSLVENPELAADVLNGWVDHHLWDAPKTL